MNNCRKIYSVVFVFIAFFASMKLKAQEDYRWKYYRWDLVAGIGPSNFLGELGGTNSIGAHYFKDLDFNATRYAGQLSLRYRFTQYTAFKVNLAYCKVSGDDKFSEEFYRRNRNLNFRSNIYEASFVMEASIFKEQIGHRYRIRGVSGKKLLQVYSYLFGGVGYFHFNPQGYYQGKWYDLQPLGTEGQGLVVTRKKYELNQFCIPLGIGFKYALDQRLSIGLEYGYRMTFTDYIDDVSLTYYDNDEIRKARGDIAAELADPSVQKHPEITGAAQQRGSPNYSDVYMFATLNVSYKFYKSSNVKRRRRGFPRFEDCRVW